MTLDRSKWKPGPWDGEPDRIEFEVGGFPCLLRRGRSGAWCGYAAVPKGHPFYGRDYHESPLDDIVVHGGLTYAGGCEGDICHAPKPGEPDDVWWFGFDCGHGFDMIPAFADLADANGANGDYRDVAFARREVERLAVQLAAAEPTGWLRAWAT